MEEKENKSGEDFFKKLRENVVNKDESLKHYNELVNCNNNEEE